MSKWRLIKRCGHVRLASSQLCLVQPFGQDGFQFAGVLEAQLKIFKAADGGLAELGAVHCSESLSYVSLRVACQQKRNTWKQRNFGWFRLSFWLLLRRSPSLILRILKSFANISSSRICGESMAGASSWSRAFFPWMSAFTSPTPGPPGASSADRKAEVSEEKPWLNAQEPPLSPWSGNLYRHGVRDPGEQTKKEWAKR